VINLILNLILIPQFGIIGSSFATVLTDAFGAMQFYFLFRHEFGAGLQFRRLSRFALATAVMGIVLIILQSLNVFILIVLGGVCYLAVVWVSGAYSADERARMTSMITRRLGFAARS
jgi:O-antigen/teichoic acid export membrane protein